MLVRPDAHPDVLALLPTLGRDSERLRRCVDAVAAQTGDHRVALVCLVNSPESGRVRELPDAVEVVECGLNLGWGGALRFGRTRGEAAYIWTVQDDMVAEPDCLDRLLQAVAGSADLAVVSPAAVGPDGLVPWGSLGGRIGADLEWTWFPPEACRPEDLAGHEAVPVVASRGMLVRTSAWDAVGGTDPRLHPVMYSDLDLCHAFERRGLRAAIVPDAIVVHARHGSTTPPFAEFLTMRNRAVFEATWYAGRERPDAVRPSPPSALDGVVHPDLPPALLASVAQAATDTVLHLGAVHSRRVEELTERVTELEATLAEVTRAAEEERTASAARLRRVRRRLRGTRRELAVARSWRGRLGIR